MENVACFRGASEIARCLISDLLFRVPWIPCGQNFSFVHFTLVQVKQTDSEHKSMMHQKHSRRTAFSFQRHTKWSQKVCSFGVEHVKTEPVWIVWPKFFQPIQHFVEKQWRIFGEDRWHILWFSRVDLRFCWWLKNLESRSQLLHFSRKGKIQRLTSFKWRRKKAWHDPCFHQAQLMSRTDVCCSCDGVVFVLHNRAASLSNRHVLSSEQLASAAVDTRHQNGTFVKRATPKRLGERQTFQEPEEKSLCSVCCQPAVVFDKQLFRTLIFSNCIFLTSKNWWCTRDCSGIFDDSDRIHARLQQHIHQDLRMFSKMGVTKKNPNLLVKSQWERSLETVLSLECCVRLRA